ncbi:MAG: redox-sensitive transcriptional activator SoxR [Pseudomonadota bacterium]
MKTNTLRRRGLTIGDLAARTGLSVSAIRHYEAQGLVRPWRTEGGQRRFDRSDIRILSFVMISQELGFSLAEIGEHLRRLPAGRAPTQADWARISTRFRADLDARIAALSLLREKLDGCIGCGCLSLKTCALWNPRDRAKRYGTGPRYLRGDPSDVE